jgi:HEAT repeat protein
MAKDKVEKQIDALKELRKEGATEAAAAALKKALADKVNLVVAKAGQFAGELQLTELLPDLKVAFARLFEEGRDPQCWGKNALVKSLKDLGLAESALFLRGLRHVQLEATWGGREDTAVTLRGASALALVQCTDIPRDETLRYLIDAMVDRAPGVRAEAAQAIEHIGGRDAILLLRLKARFGDKEPRVVGQALESVLALEGVDAVPFVAEFLNSRDEDVGQEAAFALGVSRFPEALAALKRGWKKHAGTLLGSAILRGLSASRQTEALEFLLEIIKQDRVSQAEDAVHAMALHKDSPELVERVAAPVLERNEESLTRVFRERFQ